MNTGFFTSFDQAQLHYTYWNFKPEQKVLIVLHRGHEHSERLHEMATNPLFSEYSIFAFDMRGHGYTKQEISPVFMDFVRDLDCFSQFLKSEYSIRQEDSFVVANSIAGVTVSAWVHDFAPKIAGMALLAPAFEINLIVPMAKECIALGTKLNKNLIVKSYVKSKMLTRDLDQQKAYDTDPLISREINGKLLIDLANHGKRLVEDSGAIDIPTLLLSAEKDFVVINKTQKKFFVNLESKLREFKTLEGFMHGILFEKGREQVYVVLKNFIQKSFNQPKNEISLQPDAFTVKEYEIMHHGLIPNSEKLNYKIQKWSLSKIGSVSKGMEIGLKYGFDSGISLDYVYKNKPQGKLGFGAIMDKNYLNAIGWRGIRIRKQHLLQLLEKNIQELQNQGRKVKILDIAGGTGNYLFDIKENYPNTEIVVNDFVKSNIEEGEKVVKEKRYSDFRFTNFSCFDKETYSKINFTPNLVIVSGIFELFGDNLIVNEAVKGIVSIAEPNSFLVYTGQPWHPQLKMIAFVLKSHQDKDWVMRRRSQKELDRIFAFNGIEKEKMLIDDFGIFTVSSGKINSNI